MFIQLLKILGPLKALPLWLRYSLTASIVMAFFGLRLVVDYLLGGSAEVPLFLFFIPAILIAPILFDRGSGYFAVALSSILAGYFFAEPIGSFWVEDAGEGWGLVSFVLIGTLGAALIELLRETVDELQARTEALSLRSDELERTRSELQEVAQQRQLLLSDINHRIKNHMASVAAGLALRKKLVKNDEAEAALDAAIRRLNVLGRVYTRLDVSGPEVALDAKEFLEELCADLSVSVIGLRPIIITTTISHAKVDSKRAANLGLIVNELVTNAAKYAFPEEQPGTISVSFAEGSEGCCLEVADNGIGGVPASTSRGSGTKLVTALAAQLDGTVEWVREGGTRVVVSFPKSTTPSAPASP